jgi:thiol-disulfide isomerase/thioredoxin
MSKKILVIVMAIVAGIAVSFGVVLAGNVFAPTSGVSSTEGEQAPEPAPVERDPANTGEYLDYTPALFAQTEGQKVLFFHASWCPVCRALEDDIVNRGVPADLTIFKVDYDDATDLIQKYEVRLQSTVVYVDDDGNFLSSAVLFDNANLASLVEAAP